MRKFSGTRAAVQLTSFSHSQKVFLMVVALIICDQGTCMSSQVPNLRKQAEEEIQRFRHISKPIPVCQYILEHSNSLGARFQVCFPLSSTP